MPMRPPLKSFYREFRRGLRSRRNRLRLETEREAYLRRFAELRLAVPGEGDTRKRLRDRFPRIQPRRKGDLHILAIFHNYNWEEEALTPSLGRFGTVERIDLLDRGLPGGVRRGAATRGLVDRELVQAVGEWHALRPLDVFFTYVSGEQVTPETVAALRSFGVPLVNLSLNDKEWFVGRRKAGPATGVRDICRHFDLCWTSTRDSLEKYCIEGATALYLPEGATPEVHRPYDVEKSIDVSFVGQCYGNRPAVIDALRDAGIRVEAFGPGWPDGPLSTEEMVRMYSRSRINLGFGGVDAHEGTFCLKGRDFEVPMSGGLYLTEHHEELGWFFDIGEEIITCTGIEDLTAKIRRLLANPDEAEIIRQAGRRRALAEHTWETRFAKVFDIVGILENRA